MSEDLKLIPARIRELREILGLSIEQMAQKLQILPEVYKSYEEGKTDISISTLYEIAAILDTDLTVLLTGESPRLENQCVVRADEGISIDRYPGYSFSSLAYNYIGRVMEPLLVTISPSDKPPALVVHTGQEFNYILSGRIKVTVGKREYILARGDSIYFNPQLPHKQEALEEQSSFLTIINE